MIYRILADLVVVVHLGFILFVIFGGFLTCRWRWLALIHVPAAIWGALVELRGWYCPLTPLEEELRLTAGAVAPGRASFIEHYLTPLIYPHWLTREVQMVLGMAVVVINLAAYLISWIVARRRPAASGKDGKTRGWNRGNTL